MAASSPLPKPRQSRAEQTGRVRELERASGRSRAQPGTGIVLREGTPVAVAGPSDAVRRAQQAAAADRRGDAPPRRGRDRQCPARSSRLQRKSGSARETIADRLARRRSRSGEPFRSHAYPGHSRRRSVGARSSARFPVCSLEGPPAPQGSASRAYDRLARRRARVCSRPDGSRGWNWQDGSCRPK